MECQHQDGYPCFNSATVVTPWKLYFPSWWRYNRPELQFGHGCDAVETVTDAIAGIGTMVASIRPRL